MASVAEQIRLNREQRIANEIDNKMRDARDTRINEVESKTPTSDDAFEARFSKTVDAWEGQYKSNGFLDTKKIQNMSMGDVNEMMDVMNFTDEQKTSFNKMYDAQQRAVAASKSYDGASKDMARYENIKREITSNASLTPDNLDSKMALHKERRTLEEKMKNIGAGGEYADARKAFINSMDGNGEKIGSLMRGIENREAQIVEREAKRSASSGKNAAAKETMEQVAADIKKVDIPKGGLKRMGKYALGAAAMYGLVQALSDSRGQQENGQLYSPGGAMY